MERRYLSLGRPPSKLRYFSLERSQNKRKQDVVRNIEQYFDGLDSSGTASPLSELSPLRNVKSNAEEVEEPLVEPFLKTSEDPLHNEGHHLIRTSSPVEMLLDAGRPDRHVNDDDLWASPLLLNEVNEVDEDPGPASDLKSPLKLTSTLKPSASSLNLKIRPVAEDPKTSQVSKVGPPKGGKEASAFLQKLRDAGCLKTTSSKWTSPVTVPIHLKPAEDFLILDDDDEEHFPSAPSRISIPRRANPSKSNPTSDPTGSEKMGVQVATRIPSEALDGSRSAEQVHIRRDEGGGERDWKGAGKKVKPKLLAQETPDRALKDVLDRRQKTGKGGKKHGDDRRDAPEVKGQAEGRDVFGKQDGKLGDGQRLKKKGCSFLNKVVSEKDTEGDFGVEWLMPAKKTEPGKALKSSPVTSTNRQGIQTEKGQNARKETSVSQRGVKKRKMNNRKHLKPGEAAVLHDDLEEGVGSGCPAPACEIRRRLSEEVSDRGPQQTSKEDVSERMEEHGRTSDASANEAPHGKRRRRKPGSWWLVGQEKNDEPVDEVKRRRNKGTGNAAGATQPKETTKRRRGNRNMAEEVGAKRSRRSLKPKTLPSKAGAQPWVPKSSDSILACNAAPQLCLASDANGVLDPHKAETLSDSLGTPVVEARSPIPHGTRSNMLDKRCRKPPGNWWKAPALGSRTRDRKEEGSLKKYRSDLNGTVDVSDSESLRQRARPAPWRRSHLPPPTSVRTSLASFGATYTPGRAVTRAVLRISPSPQEVREEVCRGDDELSCNEDTSPVTAVTLARAPCGRSHRTATHWPNEHSSDNEVLRGFQSGPSSVIDVEAREDMSLLSRRKAACVLSEDHMCEPPLSPVVLQVEDRAELVRWLNDVWCGPGGSPVITPEHFRWYGYRGRAMGFRIDLKCDAFSSGKILLGSYMKKPLQVDNKAVSVYNILTSSLCVKINGVETSVSSGHTFMVPCGHTFEMQNLTAEPAVLFYHRMLSDTV